MVVDMSMVVDTVVVHRNGEDKVDMVDMEAVHMVDMGAVHMVEDTEMVEEELDRRTGIETTHEDPAASNGAHGDDD